MFQSVFFYVGNKKKLGLRNSFGRFILLDKWLIIFKLWLGLILTHVSLQNCLLVPIGLKFLCQRCVPILGLSKNYNNILPVNLGDQK